MSDQFSEWDKFYARYEASSTADKALKNYRKKRKKEGTLPKKQLTPAERLLMNHQAMVRRKRIRSLQFDADMLATESALRASKNTTRG